MQLVELEKVEEHLRKRMMEMALNSVRVNEDAGVIQEIAEKRLKAWLYELRPTESQCWGCHCPKMDLEKMQPKVGKWERHYSRPGVFADVFWHCSECGGKFADQLAFLNKYCPECGAKMEGRAYVND